MAAGRPKKYATEAERVAALKQQQKEYRNNMVNVTIPKELQQEYFNLRDSLSNTDAYPFKLTNTQFFKILLNNYLRNTK